MSIFENLSMIDAKNHDMIITKTENSDHYITPKISTSVSFNNLAKVKIRTRTKSPRIHEKSQEYSGSAIPASQQITSKYKQSTNVKLHNKKYLIKFFQRLQKSRKNSLLLLERFFKNPQQNL